MAFSDSFFAAKFGITQRDLESYLSEALGTRRRLCRSLFRIPRHQFHQHRRIHRQERNAGRFAGCGRARDRGRAHRLRLLATTSAPRRSARRRAWPLASRPARPTSTKTRSRKAERRNLYPVLTAPSETAFADRVDLVKRADRAARAYDPRVFQVQASYADNLRQVMVATSDGVSQFRSSAARAHERAALARETDGMPQHGHAGGGGRVDLDFF